MPDVPMLIPSLETKAVADDIYWAAALNSPDAYCTKLVTDEVSVEQRLLDGLT